MPAEPFKFDGVLDEWKKNQIMRFCKKSVLDVGCNSGELVGYVNSIGHYAEGIDNSEPLITQAKQKYPSSTFHLGQDLSIFSDNQFESIVAWNVLEHIPDDIGVLKEFLRIAKTNVILSIPKEDELSLPYSRVTYRPYVDPTHVHYYTREILQQMISSIGNYEVYFEDTTRVRPLLAYNKLGIPLWLCKGIDSFFWSIGTSKEVFHANIMVVITKP
ncbi:MAG: class I SAM-dependent methyltransferase [Bacteroidota bacterium]